MEDRHPRPQPRRRRSHSYYEVEIIDPERLIEALDNNELTEEQARVARSLLLQWLDDEE